MRIADRFDTILYHGFYKQMSNYYQETSQPVQLQKSDNLGPASMDLDIIQKNKVTNEECERLKKIRACFYYHQEGHMVIYCPQKSKDKKNMSNQDASVNMI